MVLPIGEHFPEIDSPTLWLDEGIKPANFLQHPVIIQFWAISCPVCKTNMPRLQQFLETYKPQGLRLISIHMPRSEADTDVEKVKVAVQELGLTGPCAIDNQHILGDRFQTGGVWPCYFLFDAEGRLRSRAAGAMGIKIAENSLKRLLELQTATL